MYKKNEIKSLLSDVSITKNDWVYDLGCGDGQVMFNIEKYTGAKIRGYEISLIPFFIAKILKYFNKSGAEVLFKNFLNDDLSRATVIYTYLSTKLMSKLEFQFSKNLKTGVRVIACDFPLPEKKPTAKYSYGKHIFYLYEY
ncbi:MAG TPA: hypothetical protein PLB51_00865 [Candidatus Paceibacterota bacterium]|nr:hypothetical protein [Candidatus Paceibacterota bacterium]